MRRRDGHVIADELQQIVDTGILDSEAAVHEGLTELQRTVQQQLARHGAVAETDGHGFPGLLSRENVQLVVAIDDAERAAAHEMAQ